MAEHRTSLSNVQLGVSHAKLRYLKLYRRLWRDCHSGNAQKGFREASSAENRVATFCEAKLGVETRDTICIVCFHPCAEFFAYCRYLCRYRCSRRIRVRELCSTT